MTPEGLDVSREAANGVWIYQPARHKNTWRGRRRVVVLGPRAIGILKPRLPISLTAPLFPTPRRKPCIAYFIPWCRKGEGRGDPHG